MSFSSRRELPEDRVYLNIETIERMLRVDANGDDLVPEFHPVELYKRDNNNCVDVYGSQNKMFAVYPRIKPDKPSKLRTQFVRIGNIEAPVRFKMTKVVRKEYYPERTEYYFSIFLDEGSRELAVLQELDEKFKLRFMAHLREELHEIERLEEEYGAEAKSKLIDLKKTRPCISKKTTSKGLTNELNDIEGMLMKPIVNRFDPEENNQTYYFVRASTDVYSERDRDLQYPKKYTEILRYMGWDDRSDRMVYSKIPNESWDQLLNDEGCARGTGIAYLNLGRLRRVDKTFTYTFATKLKRIIVVDWKRDNQMGIVTPWKGKFSNEVPPPETDEDSPRVGEKRHSPIDDSDRPRKRMRV